MKFFAKLFLCTAVILTVSLSVAEYVTVSASLNSAVQHEINAALSQHQLLEYAMECSILTVAQNGSVSHDDLGEIAQSSAALLSDTDAYSLSTADGEFIAGDSLQAAGSAAEGELLYRISQVGSRRQLTIDSQFSQSGEALYLTTTRDISYVFTDAQDLLRQGQLIFLVVMGVSCVFILLVTWFLTRPIQALKAASANFSKGDYASRVDIRTRDELGELGRTYNQMAATLEEKISDLEQAARQQADFVANFAHELKTPMTSIIGYADTIYQKELPPEEVHQAAGYIVNEGMRLEALSFKLLELIALDRGDFLLEETQLAPFFADIQETILPAAAKRGVQFSMDCADGWVRMEMDLFKTLVLNLLDNALKSGGSLVSLSGQVTGSQYEISVSDNGRGIPEEELNRITEAFYMVDKSRSRKEHGAGLGLALAARIAQLHHTKLQYDSWVGIGTTVTLRLKLEGGSADG